VKMNDRTHYSHLMTPAEREAYLRVGIAFRVDGGVTINGAALSENPEVVALTRGGRDTFHETVAERIAREHADEVYFHHCPQCGGLCRTPKARQCFRCQHRWHGEGQ
jgi:hypothetical protein